jgi:CheY-like chemotaxis protein
MERADLELWKAREVARLLALVESERRYYQELAATIPVGLLVVSPDLTVLSANRAIRQIFGLTESPLRTRLDTLLPAPVPDRVAEVLNTGGRQTNIMVSHSKTGRRLRVGILAIRSLDDEVAVEVALSIEDLTNIASVGVLVPGTGELDVNAELLDGLRVQSERVQALRELAARLAHDLNNMLMIVTGHGEEAINGLAANSPLRADVQEILNASERMSVLTASLLAFTRRQPATLAHVDLESVLSSIETRSGLEIRRSLRANVVKAEPQRLQEIVKALIEGERQVVVETSHVEIRAGLKPGTYGVMDITLSARAFDPDKKHDWFEAVLPPKDASGNWASAVTRAYLSVRQWGGDIAVSAAVGGGTLVRVFLESAAEAGGPKSATAVARESAGRTSETILVVEDEPGIRALVQKILTRHGYEVLEAANGEEGLAVVRSRPGAIDLLITDVMMPGMGGPELVERLRGQGIDIKVLYLSGYTDDPNIYAAKFPPGTAFLPKPFTLAALVDKVREILKTAR